MPSTVVILQPAYLPWLGFFDQLHRADLFILLDDVDYAPRTWRTRNRVKSPQGVTWLTIPITRGSGRLIHEVETHEDTRWRIRHLATLRGLYAKAPYRDTVLEVIEEALGTPRVENLVDVNERLIRALAELAGIDATLTRASPMKITGGKTGRLLRLCRRVGAKRYLTGSMARAYMDESRFCDAGIELLYQDYEHPSYPQLHGPFVPFLSVVDLLMNALPDAKAIITSSPPGASL